MAAWLSAKGEIVEDMRLGVMPFVGMVGFIAALIMLEPDMGTTIMVAVITGTLFFVAGARISHTLTLAMWLYRRTVIAQYSPNTVRLTREQFRSCLMAVTADERHMDWLIGRKLTDRDRSPGYNRLKGIFAKRMDGEIKRMVRLPSPDWAHGNGAGKRTAS